MTEKKKHAGGRPTKYTPELLNKAREYVDGGWEREGDIVPQLAGLAVYCGITDTTIQAWKDDANKEEFSVLHARVMTMQHQELINKGLSKLTDSSLTKLLLHKHGHSDRQEVDVTSKGESINDRPSEADIATARARARESLKDD